MAAPPQAAAAGAGMHRKRSAERGGSPQGPSTATKAAKRVTLDTDAKIDNLQAEMRASLELITTALGPLKQLEALAAAAAETTQALREVRDEVSEIQRTQAAQGTSIADLERRMMQLERGEAGAARYRPGQRMDLEVKRVGPKSSTDEGPLNGAPEATAPVKVARVLVANIQPDWCATRMRDYIQSNGVPVTRVTRLKTRYPRKYTSFCVEVTEADYLAVRDEKLWAEGTLLRRFLGRPKPHQVIEEAAEDQDDEEEDQDNEAV